MSKRDPFEIVSALEEPIYQMKDLAEAVFMMAADLRLHQKTAAAAFQAVAIAIMDKAERAETMRAEAFRLLGAPRLVA